MSVGSSLVERVLADLVRVPSVNPGGSEAALAERIAHWLEPTGARLHRVESLPGRHSVAAVLEGGRGAARRWC